MTASAIAQLEPLESAPRKKVGIRHIPLVFIAPGRLFAKVEDVNVYSWALLVLLVSMALVGYATIETGLVDRRVQEQIQSRKAELEKQNLDVVDRSAMNKLLEEEEKRGEFTRLTTRLLVIVAEPAWALLAALFVSALFYGVVALGGKRPEWHTLMTICVFAAFVDLFGAVVRLGLMIRNATLDVHTSLMPLAKLIPVDAIPNGQQARAALGCALSAVDPFRIWYWLLIAGGVAVTGQLGRWRARIVCTLFCVVAMIAHAGIAFAAAMRPVPT